MIGPKLSSGGHAAPSPSMRYVPFSPGLTKVFTVCFCFNVFISILYNLRQFPFIRSVDYNDGMFTWDSVGPTRDIILFAFICWVYDVVYFLSFCVWGS